MAHVPVLLNETMSLLNPQAGETFLDATVGSGGHARAILERIGESGKLLGLDRDRDAIARVSATLGKEYPHNLVLRTCAFSQLAECAREAGISSFNGILFDLGLSSEQIADPRRGFSFLMNGPLDMRANADQRLTAADIVNSWREQEIRSILAQYGEERHARAIAKKICALRKTIRFASTHDLVFAVQRAVRAPRGRLHLATRTFQALRIAVNDEIHELENALPQAQHLLAPQGRMAVLSYHSLEDRIVKHYFRAGKEAHTMNLLTKKPIPPSEYEIQSNPRSRSAHLRAAIMQ